MATKRRAEMVSLTALSKSIDKAIGLAEQRHQAVFDKQNVIVDWEILGRILREMPVGGRDTRLDVANTIFKNVPGLKGKPVVTRMGKDVLVGFIERAGRTIAF
jgi:hypothetical protein